MGKKKKKKNHGLFDVTMGSFDGALILLLILSYLARIKKEKLIQILRSRKISFETKKRLLNCCVISVLLYKKKKKDSLRDHKILKTTEMDFYWSMLRILWTEHINSNEVLEMKKESFVSNGNLRRKTGNQHDYQRKF